MRDQVAILLKLRDVDEQVHALRRRIETADADLQRKRLEADLLRDALARERAHLQDAGRRRRAAEQEVTGCREKKTGFEKQLPDVKTNIEYQALLKEIAAMERKARDWEEVILQAMEEEEASQRTAARLEGDLAQKDEIVAHESARVAQESRDAHALQVTLEARRAEFFAELSNAPRAKYERLRAAKGDTAIVTVVQGSCGGCHYNLPPQTVNEVRKNERLILCEACGRILVWAQSQS